MSDPIYAPVKVFSKEEIEAIKDSYLPPEIKPKPIIPYYATAVKYKGRTWAKEREEGDGTRASGAFSKSNKLEKP